MRRFEEQAVHGVLILHGLPATDATEVRTWERSEAIGLLQKLVFKAIDTVRSERSPDQQQVAAWVADLYVARARPGLLQAGAEYASWAGLDVNRFWELVNGGASKQELTTFLSRNPQPYSGSSPSDSSGGFCKYVPPAPFADEYQGRTWQTCYTPCTSIALDGGVMSDSCRPPVTHEEFIRWGQARVSGQTEAFSEGAIVSSADWTASAAHGGIMARLGLLIGTSRLEDLVVAFSPVDIRVAKVAWQAGLSEYKASNTAWYAGEQLWEGPDRTFANSVRKELSNFFKSDRAVIKTLQRQLSFLKDTRNLRHLRLDVINAVWNARELLARRITDRIARVFTRISATRLGFAAEAVIFAITTVIDESFTFAEEIKLPGRIASSVVNARSMQAVDPSTMMLLTPGGRGLVRNLFANAVVPAGSSVGECGDQCPAPTPVRVASSTDPHFLVRGPNSPTRIQTSSLRLGKVVDDQWTSTEARVDGGWFVERWYDSDYGLDLQALELHYTNWNMQPETAFLIRPAEGEYVFRVVSPGKTANFNLETCREDGTCWTSSTIAYLNADGNPMLASLEDYKPPTGTPSTSPAAPQLGQAVTFNAGSFVPGGPHNGVTYKWRFQQGGCGTPCVTYVNEQPEPLYGATLTGPNVAQSWQEPGTYQVELTATDWEGRRAVTTMNVTVT